MDDASLFGAELRHEVPIAIFSHVTGGTSKHITVITYACSAHHILELLDRHSLHRFTHGLIDRMDID